MKAGRAIVGRFAAGVIAGAGLLGGAHAGVIDFTSGIPDSTAGAVSFDKTNSGVTFSFTPINNLVGGPRWISSANGISFGGGSGSSLTFDFVADADVSLDTYTLGGGVIQLGNPDFDILEGALSISSSNPANAVSSFDFNDDPVDLSAGTTYRFSVNSFGAGIRRQMASWTFTPATTMPLPTTLMLVTAGVVVVASRRRSRRRR